MPEPGVPGSLLDWARFYVSKGLSVIPISKKSKQPDYRRLKAVGAVNSEGTSSWKTYASRQPTNQELRAWFEDRTPADVGIGIVASPKTTSILDIDNANCLELFLPRPPGSSATWIARTGKGFHDYVKLHLEVVENIELSGKFELKVHDKYVVCPPSIHPSGSKYEWITDPLHTPILELGSKESAEFVERVQFFKTHWTVIVEIAKLWTPDHRHNLSLWLSGILRKRGFSRVDASRILEAICRISEDSEIKDRLAAVKDTYRKNLDQIAGSSKLREELASIIGHDEAQNLLARFWQEELGVSKKKEWTPSPDEILELQKPLTFGDVGRILGSTVKRDNPTKIVLFASMLLTYTDEEQVNILMAAESSSGKSYDPIEISLYFSEEDVFILGGASPTAFFHEVSGGDFATWDPERKVVVVDLSRKILLFLDQPHDLLLQKLRPFLSHDRKRIRYKISDRSQKAGLRTKTVELVGYSIVIFCMAKFGLDQQERTRVYQLSPETDPEKVLESQDLLLDRKSDRDKFKATLLSNQERLLLTKRILDVKQSGLRDIVIPLALKDEIKREWRKRHPHPIPRHLRDLDRFLSLVKARALLNWRLRPAAGPGRVEATSEDLNEAFTVYDEIAEANELGLAPQVYEIYTRVIQPLGTAKNIDSNTGVETSITVPVSRQAILREYFRVYHRPLSEQRLRKEILPPLDASGLISEEPDPNDKRRSMICPQSPATISKARGTLSTETGSGTESWADTRLTEGPSKDGDGIVDRALQKLKQVSGRMSWDFAIEQISAVTGDRSTAENCLKKFCNEGFLAEDPDGYWTLIRQ